MAQAKGSTGYGQRGATQSIWGSLTSGSGVAENLRRRKADKAFLDYLETLRAGPQPVRVIQSSAPVDAPVKAPKAHKKASHHEKVAT
jgi:hypothetical protein